MKAPLRRNINPTVDWKIFLSEGKKEFNKLYNNFKEHELDINDFVFIRALGEGAFGKVYLAEFRKNGKQYAIKKLEKSKVMKSNRIFQEQRILQAINFPFCIHLEMSFQTQLHMYLGLPYIPGGDMFKHLKIKSRFQETLSKFYGAQVILALEYLHYLKIVHRDVKPENIVLDINGYIKLTDFGFCKKIRDKRTYTFCGTPEYLAPEIIMNKGYGRSVDWWSFGILLFEMSAGYTPFKASDLMVVFEKTVDGVYITPKHFSEELSDLIGNLLQVDLSRRYGNLKNGANDIKYHPWFSSIDWAAIFNNSFPAPYIPINNEQSERPDWENLKKKLTVNDIRSGLLEAF